jgi:hypothetical protein
LFFYHIIVSLINFPIWFLEPGYGTWRPHLPPPSHGPHSGHDGHDLHLLLLDKDKCNQGSEGKATTELYWVGALNLRWWGEGAANRLDGEASGASQPVTERTRVGILWWSWKGPFEKKSGRHFGQTEFETNIDRNWN